MIIGIVAQGASLQSGPPPSPAPPMGSAYEGGFYAGAIQYPSGQWYRLIVAPVGGQVTGKVWRLAARSDVFGSAFDGAANTAAMAGNAEFQAGNHCLDYVAGVYSDWYLPAEEELTVIYNNLGPNIVGAPALFASGGAQAYQAATAWTSNQTNDRSAKAIDFSNGVPTGTLKTSGGPYTRPVRRLAFTP